MKTITLDKPIKEPPDTAVLFMTASTEEVAGTETGGTEAGAKKDFAKRAECYFRKYLSASGEVADVEGLACYLKITREELLELAASDNAEGREARLALCMIAKIKKQLAFKGDISASVLSFNLKCNHGYSDKPDGTDLYSARSIMFCGEADSWAE